VPVHKGQICARETQNKGRTNGLIVLSPYVRDCPFMPMEQATMRPDDESSTYASVCLAMVVVTFQGSTPPLLAPRLRRSRCGTPIVGMVKPEFETN